MNDNILWIPLLLPVIAACLLAFFDGTKNRTQRSVFVGLVCLLLPVMLLVFDVRGKELLLFRMSDSLVFFLKPDLLSMFFGLLCCVMWFFSSFFSVGYMKHEKREKTYQIFFLLSLTSVIGVCMSGNLITAYLFYELMTLSTLPLVLTEGTKESVRAGYMYLFYSIGGAFLALMGFFVLYANQISMDFVAGGQSGLTMNGLTLAGVFCMCVGFGSKAGLFPLHGWLPAAHPVAPAPASALLSGNVTKMGLLMIIRVIYYVIGPENLSGTWVQTAFLCLTLITVFMGSVIASRETLLKKRLAYSTVSQVSYALFGIGLFHPVALFGALAHVVFHSVIKNTLFLSAGSVIHTTGKTRTTQLTGIGKQMPVTMWSFTFASLALVGIPPMCAFLSKWYLCEGALKSGLKGFEFLGPIVLLISAVFTAAYLLSISIRGFLPGREEEGKLLKLERKRESIWMVLPLLVLGLACLFLGLFPNGLFFVISIIVESVF